MISDEELLETYRGAVNKAMFEAHTRDGFASSRSAESIVAGLRAVHDMSRGETESGREMPACQRCPEVRVVCHEKLGYRCPECYLFVAIPKQPESEGKA